VYIASQEGHAAAVQALGNFGANVSLPKDDGFTPAYGERAPPARARGKK
jgi:hypothetical protein